MPPSVSTLSQSNGAASQNVPERGVYLATENAILINCGYTPPLQVVLGREGVGDSPELKSNVGRVPLHQNLIPSKIFQHTLTPLLPLTIILSSFFANPKDRS
eukprot:TRINITY_DN17538_c0_g1_i1.p2 TRINITY_DN17538_c0_g1~~TRINITY_DN17538_c0_g1_i1.p2  ORF type:complete len:102 (+),score=5.78 TRINITY_DN17538_c0_g1_i1:244-549(+)